MFKSFHGFHILDALQKARKAQKAARQKERQRSAAIKAAIIAFIRLLVWNLPSDSFGIDGLTVVQQRITAIFVFATVAWILGWCQHGPPR